MITELLCVAAAVTAPLACLSAHRVALEAARRKEREDIVDWLELEAGRHNGDASDVLQSAADCIEWDWS